MMAASCRPGALSEKWEPVFGSEARQNKGQSISAFRRSDEMIWKGGHGRIAVRLTLHTDYALRMLMLLALEPDELHTIASVAQRYRISRNHLMKVAQTLIQAGFVASVRGRHGGLRLGMTPEAIRIGAVVRATEDGFAVVECFDRQRNTCVVTPACGLKKPLDEAVQAFLAVLDKTTLADVSRLPGKATRMRRLLTEGVAAAV
jgi:Rrf2 family transcriptional regulator, nitric oxide-sensitive transcriptional repressor